MAPGFSTLFSRLFNEKDGAFQVLGGRLRARGIPPEVRVIDAMKREASTVFSRQDITVTAIGVPHGNIPALAYRVQTQNKTIVFSGDQNGSDPRFVGFARGADVLVMHLAITGPGADSDLLHASPGEVGRVARDAHVTESDIWMIALDSRTARQLTLHPAFDGASTVSPDGTRIAFPSERSGQRNIWIMPLAEGEAQVRQFTTDGGRGPAWSPDGRWIAYGCPVAPTLYALCLKVVAGGPVIQVTDGKANDFNPNWAPDGKSIVVSQTSGLAVIDVASIVQ